MKAKAITQAELRQMIRQEVRRQVSKAIAQISKERVPAIGFCYVHPEDE